MQGPCEVEDLDHVQKHLVREPETGDVQFARLHARLRKDEKGALHGACKDDALGIVYKAERDLR